MSGLGTGCQGRGQGVGAGDRASRLTPPSLHQSVFGDKPSLPEYKVAAIRKPPLILLHYGAFKAGWDGLILLATLYVAVTVPYSVCVGAGGEEGLPAARGPPSACDLCVEILFMLGKAPPHLATHTLPYAQGWQRPGGLGALMATPLQPRHHPQLSHHLRQQVGAGGAGAPCRRSPLPGRLVPA